jgi:hypothetical protein
MADFYSIEVGAPTSPTTKAPGNAIGAKRRSHCVSFAMNGQAAGSRLMLPRVPKGARGVSHRITVSATLGAATLAVGIAGSIAKYAAAATYTVADTPTTLAKAANLAAELAADEDQFLTTAAAALPVGGTIVVETHYQDRD